MCESGPPCNSVGLSDRYDEILAFQGFQTLSINLASNSINHKLPFPS